MVLSHQQAVTPHISLPQHCPRSRGANERALIRPIGACNPIVMHGGRRTNVTNNVRIVPVSSRPRTLDCSEGDQPSPTKSWDVNRGTDKGKGGACLHKDRTHCRLTVN